MTDLPESVSPFQLPPGHVEELREVGFQSGWLVGLSLLVVGGVLSYVALFLR